MQKCAHDGKTLEVRVKKLSTNLTVHSYNDSNRSLKM